MVSFHERCHQAATDVRCKDKKACTTGWLSISHVYKVRWLEHYRRHLLPCFPIVSVFCMLGHLSTLVPRLFMIVHSFMRETRYSVFLASAKPITINPGDGSFH